MSISTSTDNAIEHLPPSAPVSPVEQQPAAKHDATVVIQNAIARVSEKVSPVWPLSDYVAVNPYKGFADREFLTARHALRLVSDFETLMPVDYYREQFAAGTLLRDDIAAAVDELVADGVDGAERIDVNQVVHLLQAKRATGPTADAEFSKSVNPVRPLHTLTEMIDQEHDTHWSRLILEEISRHCATHYDQGQAIWSNPWSDQSLYESWLAAARHDRSFELLGVAHFRKLTAALPSSPEEGLTALLTRINVPTDLWESFLVCEAFAMPGWSAWASYQDNAPTSPTNGGKTLTSLLAMRLCYGVALIESLNFQIAWPSIQSSFDRAAAQVPHPTDEELLRYALLRAAEIGYRSRLLSGVDHSEDIAGEHVTNKRPLAQMVFCIDVRSERMRRHLETVSGCIETFGFAGFFGLPIEFVPLGESKGSSQVPVLIAPAFQVHECVKSNDASEQQTALQKRSISRSMSETWKAFQSSAVSCFAFVETTGLFYGFKLFARLLGKGKAKKSTCSHVAPTLAGLEEQGVTPAQQVEMAASVLRGIGIVENFSRLVVFCGHGSDVENNPLQAGLDCGACGGHSGQPNARFAAKLLNQPHVRFGLAERGIEVPEDTVFVAAAHNTTTDEIDYFDTDEIPESHHRQLNALKSFSTEASQQTRSERLGFLPGKNTNDLIRRSGDWSEVRPEWGLAGNAAFIVAPRDATKSISLDGRSFLHSYDYRLDPEFAVLETIMTAPLVVANWINMQYYASTVDPVHFGSGNKTVHNVIGRFGVVSGNSGDLMTGLPWQSVHDGREYQHHPLRLLAVIAAPRQAIEAILEKHANVADLIINGWIQLVAIDDGGQFRFTEQRSWVELNAE